MDFPLPELGEGVYEAELVSWLVKPGDAVKRGQNLLEVLTDKATMEVPSPFAGTIETLSVKVGEQIKVGDVILTYRPTKKSDAQAGAEPAPEALTKTPVTEATRNGNNTPEPALAIKAAPSVRLLARQLGVDLETVRGSGPEGRVLVEDLTHYITPAESSTPIEKSKPMPLDLGTPGTQVKLVGIRRKIAEQMVRSKTTIPHYSYIEECDVSELVHLRESLKETAKRKDAKLTYLAFFVKAVVAGLKAVPIVNASLDDGEERITIHDCYNIGIAVATPQGLFVPVIHDADQKDVFQLARDIERLSREARSGKIHREDLQGGTFTITSIGGIGGLISTPVINHPEVAIMGIGKVVKRPVYADNGDIRPAHLLYLSFSFDHRVVDGAVGAVFGNSVVQELQFPARMLVE